MEHSSIKRIGSLLLALVMLVGMIPLSALTVYAGHSCPDCQDWIDGEPYCEDCYKCQGCIKLCIECGKCEECSGSEICDACSDAEVGDIICKECAIDRGSHCPDCDGCYLESLSWCAQCGACEECKDICDGCSVNLGNGLVCKECAAEGEGHCPECGGCYFEIQGWCEECLRCTECVPTCEYCSTEAGAILCVECAIDAGMHCPDCSECYGEVNGDYCTECNVCLGCVDICATHELCIGCAIDNEYHCPSCEACGEEEVICEECGEACSGCADEFCDDCHLCGNCVTVCNGCGACSGCADICENCGEYCSECEGLCDDCGLCLVCCEDIAGFEGCDCSDWMCVENDAWEEHFNEYHGESDGGHSVRPVTAWSWSETYHWHDCMYCEDSTHHTSKAKHTYDSYKTCTVCGYVKDAKIMIMEQPQDVRNVLVPSPDETYDDSNIAHFRVKAMGDSALTYTWCTRYYVNGQLTYKPLASLLDPQEGECYDGPDLYLVPPTDVCCNPMYICCIITDTAGNEVRTAEAVLQGRHNYQYYALWKEEHTSPLTNVSRNEFGHVLQCVGECCDEKTSNLRPHKDDDHDRVCDICDYEINGILITKQPKNVKNVYVCSALEDYDDSNMAHFSVEAVGDSALTYTWCRKQYSKGQVVYVPLKNPGKGENYTGPNLDLLVPTDACCTTYYYSCFITDEEGNEVKTIDVMLQAKHNYQYFKDYLSDRKTPYEYAKRQTNGHFLQCVGETCEKTTRLRPHEDADNDYFCDVCDYQRDILNVGIEVTAPKEGALPNYAVISDSVAYTARGTESSANQYRFWFVSDTGIDNWSLMSKTTAFVAGKYYKFVVDMQTAPGYTFPHYQGEPTFWACVNGNAVMPQKTYGMDLSHYTTIEYNFGICNDSVIETIVIDNVIEPVGGQKPVYAATVRGSGYYVDTQKNVYYDDWMHDRKLYYIKNGVGWFDLTDGDWLYENESFIPGHQYQVNVYLKTEDGYSFWLNKWYEILFTAAVNGTGAEGNTNSSSGLTMQTVKAAFLCQPQKVSTVMVYDLDAPRAGNTPDYTATVAYPELYQIDPLYAGTNGIVWYDVDGNMLESTDTFTEGRYYRVEIKVIPAKIDGANVCQFTPSTVAYIDGVQITERYDWDAVYASANTAYLYYTFPKGALPAKTNGISGQVTSGGNATDPVTLQLIPQGTSEAAYETQVTGNTAKYVFPSVPNGSYTLVVTKSGMPTQRIPVTMNHASLVITVNMVRPGDVNEDGIVNIADATMVFRAANGRINLTDKQKAVADVNGDGIANIADATMLFRYANGRIASL